MQSTAQSPAALQDLLKMPIDQLVDRSKWVSSLCQCRTTRLSTEPYLVHVGRLVIELKTSIYYFFPSLTTPTIGCQFNDRLKYKYTIICWHNVSWVSDSIAIPECFYVINLFGREQWQEFFSQKNNWNDTFILISSIDNTFLINLKQLWLLY